MSKYNELTDRINEEVGGMVAPATSVGLGIALSYLPGEFSTMKKHVNSLNRLKRKWQIEVLDEGNKYKLNFENTLSISILKKDFNNFNENVLNIQNKNEVDLTEILQEAINEISEDLFINILKALKLDLRNHNEVQRIKMLSDHWVNIFSGSIFLPIKQTAIELSTYDINIETLVEQMKSIYKDDVGELQQILTAIENNESLNTFKPFNKYDYLVGVRIQSKYNYVNMFLELLVNNSMISTQSLYIDNQSVLEELETYRDIKVVNRMIYPKSGIFKSSFFSNIKQIIDDIEE